MDKRDAVSCTAPVRAGELVEAAWAALTSGRPQELERLEKLLELPLASCPGGPEERASLRQLGKLLTVTERNLRILRGQVRLG